MAQRLVLHIGVQKSGTTFLQRMLEERAGALEPLGVVYPMPEGGGPVRVNAHEAATYGLLGGEYPWVGARRAAAEEAWWQRLREQVRGCPGTAVVSAEALAVVRSDAAQRVIDELGADEVRVVVTARSLGRLLPSSWQQHVRNGRTAGFPRFVSGLAAQRARGWESVEKESDAHMWRAFGLGRLAGRWASLVGPDRVAVVSNPGSGSGSLWHRFMEAAGLSEAADRVPAPTEGTTVHGGVTAAEAEVLRALNGNLSAQDWAHEEGALLRDRIVDAFRAREERGPRVAVPPRFREQVAAWSAEDIDDLRASGALVVGSLEELAYTPAEDPDPPRSTDITEAAGTAALAAAMWSAPTPAPAEQQPRKRRVLSGLTRRMAPRTSG
ncbi:hypothetical protein [Nocardiopsis suaedae]|uniref:Sulfotransferase family protein n=1 Tax=Nocardiopsis suaedae TaxID=3018444 RepID=A0ABT4TEY9_9ACTN|nr:hypothetical protein [Nocardiopsis suaedae]MDA2803275.1 hypothetical protein [Nocardiopsis suaedae]